jgi:hypothetical protein
MKALMKNAVASGLLIGLVASSSVFAAPAIPATPATPSVTKEAVAKPTHSVVVGTKKEEEKKETTRVVRVARKNSKKNIRTIKRNARTIKRNARTIKRNAHKAISTTPAIPAKK